MTRLLLTREAIGAIYDHAGELRPNWIEFDHSHGWASIWRYSYGARLRDRWRCLRTTLLR